MAQYDSAIILHAKLDGKTAESDLKKFRTMAAATGKEIAALDKRIDTLKNGGDMKLTGQLDAARKAAADAAAEMETLRQKADAAREAEYNTIRKNYLKAGATDEHAKRNAAHMSLIHARDKNTALFQNLEAVSQKYDECTAAVRRLEQAVQEEDGQRQREIAGLQQQRDALEENLHAMEKSLDAQKRLGRAADAFSQFGKDLNKNAEKFSNRLQGLAGRVFVFTLITSALRSMRTWLGNVIQTNDAARTAVARLQGALLTLAQPLVQVVIPAFTAFVNVLTALITRIAEFVSLLFGASLGKSAQAAKALNKQTKALGGVAGAAKEASKSFADFDEIHVLDTGSGDVVGGGGAGVGDIAPDFDFMEGVTDKLKEVADLVLLIGAGLALWKIAPLLPEALKNITTVLGGILMTTGGLIMFFDGLSDALQNGVDWVNLIEMIGGLAAAAFGLYTVFKVLVPSLADFVAGVTLIIGGLTILATGFTDAVNNGWNLQNTLLTLAGIVATGLGFFFLTGSVIPLVIAGFAALLTAITIAMGNGGELIEGFKLVLHGLSEFISGAFAGDWERAWNGIKDIFKGFAHGLVTILYSAYNLIIDGLNWLIDKINGISIPIPGFLGGGTIGGLNIRHIEHKTIPALAQGAVIPPNREFLAVLGDQTSGTNIEAPSGLIKQMVLEALAESGALNGGDINIHFSGDITPLVRLLRIEIERENKRVGPGLIGGAFT